MGSLEELQGLVNVRSQFQDAVVSLIILRQIDWPGMVCPHCKGEGGVVFDGTKVAMQSLQSRLQNTWRVHNQARGAEAKQTPSEHLVFTQGLSTKVKKLLLRFTLHRKRFDRKKRKFCINPTAGLLKDEYQLLGKLLTEEAKENAHAAALRALTHAMLPRQETVTIKRRRKTVTQELFFPNKAVRLMLQALVSCYPVQAVLPPAAVMDVHGYIDGLSRVGEDGLGDLADVLQKIKQSAPLVHDFIESMVEASIAASNTGITAFMTQLLGKLCVMSLLPFGGTWVSCSFLKFLSGHRGVIRCSNVGFDSQAPPILRPLFLLF